jgi:hypothetical protein
MISYGSVRNFREVLWERYCMISNGFARDFRGALWERDSVI